MAGQLKAFVYNRVSTDVQERDGTSLDTQERASEEYVSFKGVSAAKHYFGPRRILSAYISQVYSARISRVCRLGFAST